MLDRLITLKLQHMGYLIEITHKPTSRIKCADMQEVFAALYEHDVDLWDSVINITIGSESETVDVADFLIENSFEYKDWKKHYKPKPLSNADL